MVERRPTLSLNEYAVLGLLVERPRHGYDIGQRIELRSRGTLRFNVASLYPLLYRLEKRGWIRGRWVEKPGQRRRRYYRLTPAGRKVLAKQREGWREFVAAIRALMSRVREAPAQFPIVPRSADVHRAVVERFPYVVVFLVREDTIHVLAVAHQRRRPTYWRGRATSARAKPDR